MCTAAAGSHDAARDGANAGACIDDAVAVDGAGDNDAARVAVVTDRLRLTIAMEAASCTAPGDTGDTYVRRLWLIRNFLGSLRELCDVQQMG